MPKRWRHGSAVSRSCDICLGRNGRTDELEAAQTYDHIAHSPNCSIAKAERMLGYRPRYRSIEAVCESVSWLIEREIVQIERKAV
jgi:hypothetical protein